MSSGQKECHDEIRYRAFDSKVEKLKSLHPAFVMHKLQEIQRDLEAFDNMAIQLPRYTWRKLYSINQKLKELGV